MTKFASFVLTQSTSRLANHRRATRTAKALRRHFAQLVGASLLWGATQNSAQAAKIIVSGSTRIEARAERASGLLDDVVIRGTLRDDVGKGVAESHVAIALYEPGSAVAIPLPAPLRCTESAGAHEPHAAPDEYVVDTDSQGSFCLHTMLPPEPLVMS